MRNSIKFFFALLFVAANLFFISNDANAQNRRGARGGQVYSKQYIEQLLERIEERSDDFTKIFDEALDDSRLDTTRTEENYTDRSRELEHATDELRREFDHNDTRGETSSNVRKVLTAATVMNRIMSSRNFGRAAETSWTRFRTELNELARIYRLPAVGSSSYKNARAVRPVSRGASIRNSNLQIIEQLLERIEERSDAFTKSFDESLDDSRLNGTRIEETYTDIARFGKRDRRIAPRIRS